MLHSVVHIENIVVPVDKQYVRIEIDVENYSAGSAYIVLNGLRYIEIFKNGSKTRYIGNAWPGSFTLAIEGDNASMKIKSISLKALDAFEYRKKTFKFAHQSHLNGIKYPNSQFYSGAMRPSVDPSVNAIGRKTEFLLTSNTSNEWKSFGFDIWDYVFIVRLDEFNENYISDVMHFNGDPQFLDTTQRYRVSARNSKEGYVNKIKKLQFKFAIVIDNPDKTSKYPKLIGPLSEIVTFYLDNSGVKKYAGVFCGTYGRR